MKPPVAPEAGQAPIAGDAQPAVSVCPVVTLRKRSDFLRAARGRRQVAAGFLLQARRRDPAEPAEAPIRVGFTCSKKLGNAVVRNRAKRRLREIARATLPQQGRTGWDYVLVGRPGETATQPYATLLEDLEMALRRLHGARR